MPWVRHRVRLLWAAVLDGIGLFLIALIIGSAQGLSINPLQPRTSGVLLVLTLIYCSLSWLFGSYTLLKLRRVSWSQAFIRLGSASLGSLVSAILIGYLFRLQATNILFFRSFLIPLFLGLSLWSGLSRIALRRGWPQNQDSRWQVLALPEEINMITAEWKHKNQNKNHLQVSQLPIHTSTETVNQNSSLAISPGCLSRYSLQELLEYSINQGLAIHSMVEMAEEEMQRIPAKWIGSQWLLFSNQIDGLYTSFNQQLKRYADVTLSCLLLLLSFPLLIIVCLLVKLQDGGPIFYKQQRTGLHGASFHIIKIRTMDVEAESSGPQWSKPNDQRITPIGRWLRRTRLDEIPQLLNVLKGEMSLIGPRPERPELDLILETKISNYKLRNWIRPGLSGWAQVNMPYSSSIEDSEIKLSYDLYYIRNKNIWIDLIILFKTIKIILKASGR